MISLRWYRSFLVFISVAVFFTNFSDFSQRFGIIPLYWIVFLAALAAPAAIPALIEGRVQIGPLVWWAAGFLLVSIVWYFPSVQTADSFQDLQTRVLSVMFLGLMLFIVARPSEQYTARVAIAWAVMLAVAFNVYELFNPLTFSDIPGRSSGLYSNVNQSGAALVLGMIIAYDVVSPRLRLPFVTLTAIGIVTTFSRAAMLGWILVMIYFAARSGLQVRQLRRVVLLCILAFGFIVSPYWGELETSLQHRGVLTLDVVGRLNFFGGGGTGDESSAERAQVASYAWRLFSERPFTGYGTGAHRQLEGFEVSTHNIYLAMMIDHGIIGFFFLPLLLLATAWGFTRKHLDLVLPFAMFLTMWGLFSHNVLEERYILVSVALVGSIVASERGVTHAAREARIAPNALPLGAPA